jgi:4-amino-4-deoxy-L-arabinose transferase-like glycosyltransferase
LSRWAVVPVLAGALLVRLWHLGARSLWTDEGSTWTAATASLPELIRLCAQKDASPPLFYLLTAATVRLGGDEAHLRLVSVLASLGLVWLTYRIGRLFMARGESTLAAGFVALSPFQLMFAQEARTYALVACLATASFYFFLRAAVLGRRRDWIPYVVVSTLALYTQSIALLGFGVQGALVVLDGRARRRIVPWLGGLAAVGLLYLPWVFVSMTQMSRLSHSHWYLEPPTPHSVFQVLRSVFLSPIPLVAADPTALRPGLSAWIPAPLAHLVLLALPLVPLLVAARQAFGGGERAAFLRILALAVVLPLLAVFAVSFRTPLWLPRYFVLLTPALSLLLAAGIHGLAPRGLAVAWGTAFLIVQTYACHRYDTDYTKEPWRDVARMIAHDARSGRTAVLVPFDLDPYRFYNTRLGTPVAAFEVSHPEVPFASSYTPLQLDQMEDRAARATTGFDHVWVVVRSPSSDVRRELAARAERAAARGRIETRRWRADSFGGPLRVARYSRAEPAGR